MGPDRYVPSEILISIFAFLTTEDIKSARLVCNRFGAVGALSLIKTAYFATTANAMERFLNIANHPVFSRTIRTVIYQGYIFMKELTDWKHFFVRSGPNQEAIENGCLTREAVMRSFRRYCSLYENQQRLTDSGEAVAALTDGLRKMINVDTILFVDIYHGSDRYGFYGSDRSDGIKPELFPSKWSKTGRLSDFVGLLHILTAVSVSKRRIPKLEIGHKHSSETALPCSFFRLSPQDLQHGWQAFRGLISLSIELGHEKFAQRDGDLDGLFYMLSGAEHLETLYLHIRESYMRRFRETLKSALVRQQFWPCLRNLSLEHVACEYDFVKAILWNQRSTLSRFRLYNAKVYGMGEECNRKILRKYAKEHLNKACKFDMHCEFIPGNPPA